MAKTREVETKVVENEPKALVSIREREAALEGEAGAVTKIRTQEDRTLAAKLRASLKDLLKVIHDELDPIVDSAYKTWQMNLLLRKRHVDPVEAVDRRLKRLIDEDKAEQDRIAEAKRKKLQDEADERARKERKDQVAALKKSGQKEAAAVLAEAPVVAAPVQVVNRADQAAAGAGLTFKITQHTEIVEPLAIPREYLTVNESAIRAAGMAYWQTIKPPDPKDGAALAAAIAKFSAWQGIRGARFWITKESADTGRRGG